MKRGQCGNGVDAVASGLVKENLATEVAVTWKASQGGEG